MPHYSFKKKFIVLLLLVSLIPTIFIGLISYEIGKESLYERIEMDLATQAEHIMDQIDRFLYERHNDTQLLISDSVLIDPEATDAAKGAILKEYLLNLGLYDNIHLLNLDGKVVASTYTKDNHPDFAEQDWFNETKKLFYYTGDVQQSPFTGKPTIFFSNVILDADNQPRGIILAEILWPTVTEFLSNVPAPAQAYLLNKNNIEIGGGSQQDILSKDWSGAAAAKFADPAYLVTDVSSSGYLVYKGNNWKLVLRTPVNEAMAPLNRLFILIGLFLLGVVVVILLTGFIIGSKFVNPIKKLTVGAQEIKEGNLDQKIQVKSKDEIGFLALTFNDMAKSIKQKQARIEQEMQKELQLQKEKDQIWTTASHNLRTPLTGINWVLEMLNKGMLGELNDKQRDALGQITKNTVQLNYLVNVLLDVSKMEGGKIRLTKEEFFFEDVLRKALERKDADIKTKQLKVSVPDLKKPKLKMMLDPEKTQQVFNAIIDNAVIYSNNKGSLEIEIKTAKKKVICSVSDTGIGISGKDLKKVFGKFMKGENSETKNATGIGLGLYLADIIVRSSKGKIWAESKLGKGSKFFVELPLA